MMRATTGVLYLFVASVVTSLWDIWYTDMMRAMIEVLYLVLALVMNPFATQA